MKKADIEYKIEESESKLRSIGESIVQICKGIMRRSKVSGIWHKNNIDLENKVLEILSKKYDQLPYLKRLFITKDKYLKNHLKLPIREFNSIAIKNESELDVSVERAFAMPEDVHLNLELSRSEKLSKAHEDYEREFSNYKRLKIKLVEIELQEAKTIDEKKLILSNHKRNKAIEFIESNDLVNSVFFGDSRSLTKRQVSQRNEIQQKFEENRNKKFENSFESKWLKIQEQYLSNIEFLEHLSVETEHEPGFVEYIENAQINSAADIQNYLFRIIDESIRHKIIYHKGYKIFWQDNKPLREDEFQDSLINMISPYLELKYISIAREPQVSEGKIDLLLTYNPSRTKLIKLCVEIKKAHNKVELGITKQLPAYLKGMQTERGIYVVLWFKGEYINEPKEFQDIGELKIALDKISPTEYKIETVVLDVNKIESPSKLK